MGMYKAMPKAIRRVLTARFQPWVFFFGLETATHETKPLGENMKLYQIGRTRTGFYHAWQECFKTRKAAIEKAKKFSLGCLEQTSVYACDGDAYVEIIRVTPQVSESGEVTFIVLKV